MHGNMILFYMKSCESNLPKTVQELQALVVDLQKKYDEEYSLIEKKYSKSAIENKLLREENRLLRLKLFGRKSEKYTLPDLFKQLSFFDNLEEDYTSDLGDKEEKVDVTPHKRRKGGRRPLPEELPREVVIHDIPESEKICGCGCKMSRIGEETSEKLEMEQPKVWVKRHIRYKYAC